MGILNKHKVWHKVLKNDVDYDYGSLLAMERFKLSRMAKWFKDNNYGNTESGPRTYRELCLAVKLIDAATEDDDFIQYSDIPIKPMEISKSGELISINASRFKLTRYVNLRNWSRYFNAEIDKLPRDAAQMLLRQEKAWKLYCKLREYRMQHWWD